MFYGLRVNMLREQNWIGNVVVFLIKHLRGFYLFFFSPSENFQKGKAFFLLRLWNLELRQLGGNMSESGMEATDYFQDLEVQKMKYHN